MNKRAVGSAYARALSLLGRREYCRAQLTAKLMHHYPAVEVATVLDKLEQEGSLSDQRFAGAYCRQRMSSGFGPLKIGYQMIQKGVPRATVDAVLNMDCWDWEGAALEVAIKRFRTHCNQETILDIHDKEFEMALLSIKLFLKQRGFTFDQIEFVGLHIMENLVLSEV